MWCLCLDGIYWGFHPTARVEVLSGIAGEFVTKYLAENGRRILIIGQLSVNDSVQFLGLYDQAWGSGLPFIANLLDHVGSTAWGSSNNSNDNWGVQINDTNSIIFFVWDASVNSRPVYLSRSPVNPHAV